MLSDLAQDLDSAGVHVRWFVVGEDHPLSVEWTLVIVFVDDDDAAGIIVQLLGARGRHEPSIGVDPLPRG